VIARNARLIIITDVTIILSTVVSSLIGARALGPAGRGDLLVVVLWPPVVAMFAGLGLPAAYRYWMAKEPERASRPFSRDRDGFVIAEGAWFFILEEMEQAKERGAHMYGEIAGYGSTCEAYHRVRLEECGEEPARAMGMAMDEAGIPPSEVQYIHYHGTSTELNDRIETRAVKLAFNGHAYKLAGSSLKSMIGHPQGACGAAGIAATLLSMRDGVVPPTINLDESDPECDLDYIPEAGRKLQVEHAVANCIAFGSKNSAMVLRRV